MISADFSISCEGSGCTATFSDGMNRPVDRMHDAWIVARMAGWREVHQRGKVVQLCPACFKKFLEVKR